MGIYISIIPLKGYKGEEMKDWGVSESFFSLRVTYVNG
jgi:hypothetical protein